jgi:hypothetical protein
MAEITLESPDSVIVAKFPDLLKSKIADIKKKFRSLDENGNGIILLAKSPIFLSWLNNQFCLIYYSVFPYCSGVLEFEEVKRMFELAGLTLMESHKLTSI